MLTRGEMAKQVGCNIETIRYYENIGLISEPERAPNGYRQYAPHHVKQLEFIQRAKELGFSVDAVRNLLSISENRAGHTRSQVKALADSHIDEVATKIRDLTRLKQQLKAISEHCDGAPESAQDCPIITALSGES